VVKRRNWISFHATGRAETDWDIAVGNAALDARMLATGSGDARLVRITSVY